MAKGTGERGEGGKERSRVVETGKRRDMDYGRRKMKGREEEKRIYFGKREGEMWKEEEKE